jgi:all-trans-retinol 13,14-reductase
MANGGEFRAPCVVSDAGVDLTFGSLVPEALRGALVPGTSAPIEPSVAHLSLYLGIRGSAAELELPKTNIWHFDDYDHDRSVERSLRDPDAPFCTFMSFPSAKDPDFERRHPGSSTIEVIAFVPYRWFAPWQDTRWRKRRPDYEEQKARLEARLLDVALREVPSIRGRILHAELSTPLSTRHFTNHPHGEAYGLAHSPARFEARWLRPRTAIQGLFLTGVDVCSAGVTGALMGGVLSASVVLNRNLFPAMMKVDKVTGAPRRPSHPLAPSMSRPHPGSSLETASPSPPTT